MPIKPTPRVRHMQDSDTSTLQNICRVAAERFSLTESKSRGLAEIRADV